MRSKTFYVILSISIAILLWVYVVYEVNPTYETWIEDVPVTAVNVNEKFDSGELKISGDSGKILSGSFTVDVKIRGDRNIVSSIGKKDVICEVDMDSIDGSGSYTLRPTIEVNKSNIEIIKSTPSAVKFEVDEITRKTVDIELICQGEPPAGYTLENLSQKTETVKITGPVDIVNNVQSAQIILDCGSLKSTDSEKSLKIMFLDKNGDNVDASLFTNTVVNDVKVTFNLITEKEVVVLLTPKYKDDITHNHSGNHVKLSVKDENANENGALEIKVVLRGTGAALDKYSDSKTTVYTEEIDVSNITYNYDLYSVSAAPLPGNIDYVEVPVVNVKAEVEYQR